MRLFRNQRNKALTKRRIFKYLAYSFGEIVIVTFGIMIAVFLNNRNQDAKADLEIQNYYERIQQEIETNIQLVEDNSTFTKDSIVANLKVARHIIQNNLSDSLRILHNNIKYLTESESLSFQFPMIDEFIGKGYLSQINDAKLNRIISAYTYSRSQCDLADELTLNYQIHLIKPFAIAHTKYANVDYYNFHSVFSESIAQELEPLLRNAELENIISLYISHMEKSAMNFDGLGYSFEHDQRQD